MPRAVLHSVAVPVHMKVQTPPEHTWSVPQAMPQPVSYTHLTLPTNREV